MSEIESAKAFAVRINDLLCEHDRNHTIDTGEEETAALIEADRNAVRVALAAEIQASALALDDTGLTFTWREAVIRVSQMVMFKYTQPKEPKL